MQEQDSLYQEQDERKRQSYPLRYSPRKQALHQRELSPWDSQEYKKMFRPAQYYQTITNQQKQQSKTLKNNSKSLSIDRNPFGNRVGKDFSKLVRLQKKGAFIHYEEKRSEEYPMKSNLVMVNLEQQSVDDVSNNCGTTIDHFNSRRKHFSRESGTKEQPMRVRIFKKFKKRIEVGEDTEAEFLQSYQMPKQKPESAIQQTNVYPAMPKRSTRMISNRQKAKSTIQQTKNDFFPKITIQKQKDFRQSTNEQSLALFCKGQIIKKDTSSKKKLNYRPYHKKQIKNQQQNIIFLQQFCCQI